MGGESGIPHLWLDNICDGNHLYVLHINGWRMCKLQVSVICKCLNVFLQHVYSRLELSIFLTASSDIEHNCSMCGCVLIILTAFILFIMKNIRPC